MKIKAIFFDFDQTIIELGEIHYLSLNQSLKEIADISIDINEHNNTYNGLTTNEKLKLLTKNKNLSTKDIDNNVKLKFLKKAVFSYGCNMHEHALYGACLDGLCGRRGQWEQTLILKRDMNRLEGLDNEYVRHKHIIYNICNYTYI